MNRRMRYVVGIVLAFFTYYYCYLLPTMGDYQSWYNLTFMFIALMTLSLSYLYPEQNFKKYINGQRSVIIVLASCFIIGFFFYPLLNINVGEGFLARLTGNFYYLTLIFLMVAFVDKKRFEQALKVTYFLYFVYGVILTLFVHLKITLRGEIINENVVAFFMLPYLTYLFINSSTQKVKLIVYGLGSLLLLASYGKTSFLAFVLLPLFIFVVKKANNNLRYVLLFYMILANVLVFVIVNLPPTLFSKVDDFLTFRPILWKEYIDSIGGISTFIFGTGNVLIEGLEKYNLPYMPPHNNFVSVLFFNGLIGLFLYIMFIIMSVPKKVKKILPTDAIIFVMVTVQFAESFIPFFDFCFFMFVFAVNLFISRSLHESERNKYLDNF